MSGTKKFDPKKLVPNFAHYVDGCEGDVIVVSQDRTPIGLTGLGYTVVKNLPMVVCKRCEAAFLPEGLDLAIEQAYAKWLLIQSRQLAPQELRFVRVLLGISQSELAGHLDSDRTYISKCESQKSLTSMSFDKQLRMRIFAARKLAASEAEFTKLATVLADIQDRQDPPENFENPVLPEEVELAVRRALAV